ncbi:hypothetical protein F5B20DRAFT_573726 [Whalleya microplaca]|nr:hypothetical protein F5B20DRAFT_573726 [Whalleya microplaca]
MAIIKEIPGLEATIQVNGKDLVEYDEPHPEETDREMQRLATATKESDSVTLDLKSIPRVRKYIEATSGTAFGFRFVKYRKFRHQCNHIAVSYESDGCQTDLAHEPDQSRRKAWANYMQELVTGNPRDGYEGQALIFGKVTIDHEDPRGLEDVQEEIIKAKRYGILRTLVYRMKPSTVVRDLSNMGSPCPEETSTNVPEKALKGRTITHNVQYSRPLRVCTPEDEPEDVYQDPSERPFAIFEFRYMSKEGLIREGILPNPTPIDNMNHDELVRYARDMYLKEQERALNQESNNQITKKEEDECSQGIRKRAHNSTEGNPAKRYKETQREDGKVEVDLTD